MSHMVALLFLLWLLSMIVIPIGRWTFGDTILAPAAMVSVSLQAATVLAALVSAWGAARTAQMAALILPASWLIEFIGSRTGLPFGYYHYTDKLMPQIGAVPLLIPLAWLMMLPAAWSIAHRITGQSRGAAFVWLSGLSFMAWDLFLDPQMVSWGFWVWEEQAMLWGGYFGIPWLNFVGWTISAALLTRLVLQVMPLEPLPLGWLYTIYVTTWALETVGLAFIWRLPGPALVGFLSMGLFVALAARAARVQFASASPTALHPRIEM